MKNKLDNMRKYLQVLAVTIICVNSSQAQSSFSKRRFSKRNFSNVQKLDSSTKKEKQVDLEIAFGQKSIKNELISNLNSEIDTFQIDRNEIDSTISESFVANENVSSEIQRNGLRPVFQNQNPEINRGFVISKSIVKINETNTKEFYLETGMKSFQNDFKIYESIIPSNINEKHTARNTDRDLFQGFGEVLLDWLLWAALLLFVTYFPILSALIGLVFSIIALCLICAGIYWLLTFSFS